MALTISQVKESVRRSIEADTPVMLWGPPGIGKSESMAQLAEEMDYRFIDIRLSQMDAVDLRGIPHVDKATGRTNWAIPTMWPDEDDETPTLIMFDEINHATSATLSAAFQAIQERRIGEYKFPKAVRIVAAANEERDGGAVTKRMPPPLNNRFTHFYAGSSHEDWIKWAVANGVDPMVTGFIRFSPDSLNEFIAHSNTEEERARVSEVRKRHAFATPRSWAAVNRYIRGATDGSTGKIDLDPIRASILGTVGTDQATKFNGYIKYYMDMPDLDKVIKNPMQYDVPEAAGMRFAMCAGLSSKSNMKNFGQVLKYVTRMEKEFQAMVVKDAVNRNLELLVHPDCLKWQDDNENLLD